MLRSIAILSAITFLVSPAAALPFSVSPVASVKHMMHKKMMMKKDGM